VPPLPAFSDPNYYVLAPGGTSSSAAGWYLANGAKISSTVQPDGTTGGVLGPAGAIGRLPDSCQVFLALVNERVSLGADQPLPTNRSGWQQVRFTLYAAGRNGTFLIDNFWINPRASR
jgi:hypothetical protein